MSSNNGWPGRVSLAALGALAAVAAAVAPAPAADHGDAPLLSIGGSSRHDARLTDLFAFDRGDDIVLALCTNPAIPTSVTSYRFPSDLVLRFYLDVDATVDTSGNGLATTRDAVAIPGGVLLEPAKVFQDARITVGFDADGNPEIGAWTNDGMDWKSLRESIRVFAGLRDDPFIRGPREGRNVAAIVLQFPREILMSRQDAFLVWAKSEVRGYRASTGEVLDTVAQPLRSQFPENDDLNFLEPRDQWKRLGVAPDVLLLDMSKTQGYPNGRLLTDDVVDVVADPRILNTDAPYPSVNDVPFLADFPYLAPPHSP